MKVEGIDKVDPVYYTVAHGDGYSRERAIVVVGRGRGTAEVARPSVLHAAECAARRARLRSVCRRPVPRVLRAGHGPTELGAWPVFSAATGGLLRGHRFGTRDRVARDRLVGGAQLSAARPGGRPARSFDDRADAAPDRGVVARIVTSPHDAHRQDPHRPMRYDTGRPRAIIRFKISQPRTASLPCPAGLRARRPSPRMDL